MNPGIAAVNPQETRMRRLLLAGWLMVFFGLAEIWTGFKHSFLMLSTAGSPAATLVGSGIGLVYVASGLLALARRKGAALAAALFLGLDVLGRTALVLTGLYPVNNFLQGFSMAVGTAIVVFFAVYLWTTRKFLR